MAFRFWRRMRLAPGITLNLSKSGPSVSFGPRGARLTVGPRGRRTTVGIPGTGLFYTVHRRGSSPSRSAAVPPAQRLDLGFFRRLVTPPGERAFVDGCRAALVGRDSEAIGHFEQAAGSPDGAFMAGMFALKEGDAKAARAYLEKALRPADRLGRLFAKYGIGAAFELPVAEQVCALVRPDRRGVLLALVEATQALGDLDAAQRYLEALRRLEPDDPVVLLSLVEVLLERGGADRAVLRRVVKLCAAVENESPVHTALLLYKGRALRLLGLADAACETLSAALRRRKGRPAQLMLDLRYERALALESLGRKRQARRDLEHIYAQDPDYGDVAERLGL